MSAWMVSKAHIDAMVAAAMGFSEPHESGMRWAQYFDNESGQHTVEIHYTDHTRASEVGMMLWAENLASIHYRYPDTAESDNDYPGPLGFSSADVATYKWRRTTELAPEVILNAISCYEYQSCEHPGWRTSEARSFCDALRHKMIYTLPGVRSAPWGLDEDHVRAAVPVSV